MLFMTVPQSTVAFSSACSHVFFFFQAEDGIRDLTVTGVQTCALPISFRSSVRSLPLHEELTVTQPGVFYLGHVDATVRERTGGEFKAGPSIPLIDQAEIGRASCRERV